jgi:hypothetical protein
MLQAVRGAQADDAIAREGTARGRSHAPFIQQVRNFRFGVGVEELVDLPDNGRVGRAQFDARLRQGDVQ